MPSNVSMSVSTCFMNSEDHPQRMFCNLSEPTLSDFNAISTEIILPKGELLFRQGWQSTSIFILGAGKVKLSCTSKGGRILLLKIAQPGDVLGLGAVISGSTYEVSAETIQPVPN